jgi:hypothetical protein
VFFTVQIAEANASHSLEDRAEISFLLYLEGGAAEEHVGRDGYWVGQEDEVGAGLAGEDRRKRRAGRARGRMSGALGVVRQFSRRRSRSSDEEPDLARVVSHEGSRCL